MATGAGSASGAAMAWGDGRMSQGAPFGTRIWGK